MKLLALVILLSAFSSLALTEVVGSFERCYEFFFPNPDQKKKGQGIIPTGFTEGHYKMICQRWNNQYRFATLYDTKRRIPAYSAYAFLAAGDNRPEDIWKIEPQLDGITKDPNGKPLKDPKEMMDSPNQDQAIAMNIMHQAVDSDYRQMNIHTRGHVFPSSFARDQDQAQSTFTLTNVAPQTQGNNGDWEQQVETPMRNEIINNCRLDQNHRAYIVTGVVPGNNWQPITRDKEYEEGINVPSHYWSAYCCKSRANVNNLIGRGYIARQGNFNLQTTTIQDVTEKVGKLYNSTSQIRNFSVFPGLPENINPPV